MSARILIFTGDGKGKTTAAMGTALRAVSHGKRVFIVQFVKNSPSGEIDLLKTFENVKAVQAGAGFLPEEDSPEFKKHIDAAQDGLRIAEQAIDSGQYDLFLLDEICFAVSKGLLDEEAVAEIISKADSSKTLLLTGRNASDKLIEIADTVSEVKCVKHGYDKGIQAQKGVEF